MSWFSIFWKDKISLETHKWSLLATLSIIDISLGFIGEVLHNRKGFIINSSPKQSIINYLPMALLMCNCKNSIEHVKIVTNIETGLYGCILDRAQKLRQFKENKVILGSLLIVGNTSLILLLRKSMLVFALALAFPSHCSSFKTL